MISKAINFYVDIKYPNNCNKEDKNKIFEKALSKFHRITNESKLLVLITEKSFFEKKKKRTRK